jgi:uncharacterized protein (DUF1810 family)
MTKEGGSIDRSDPFNLNRFTSAQEGIYNRVLAELKNGEKRTHWMWFIFPQIDGLGFSSASKYYAIKSIEEARHFLSHPALGKRLLECAEAVLAVEGRSVAEIFGYPDDMKLKSCMTLFVSVSDAHPVFVRVLEKYFNGEHDARTLQLLEQLERS